MPLKRILLALVLSIAFGFVGLYVVVGTALFEAETYRVQNPSVLLAAVCAVALLALWLLPGERLRLLCLNQNIKIPYRSALLVHLLSWFAGTITPGNSAQGPAIPAALARLGVPVGKGVGVMMQIIVLDLIFYAWAVPLSLWYLIYSDLIPLPGDVKVLTLVAASLAFAGAIFLSRYPRLIVGLLLALAKRPLLGRFQSRLRKIARDYYRSSRSYIRMPVSSWLRLHLITAVSWLAGFVLLWGLLELYGIEASLLGTLALLNVITLASQLVPTPGAAGFMEAAVGLSVGAGSVGGLAGALIVWRLTSLYLIFAIGPLASFLLFLSPPVERTGSPTMK